MNVVGVCLWAENLRLPDQAFRLHVVCILADVINRHLEPLSERKSKKLRLVFLEIDGAGELPDVDKPEFAFCLIIQHGNHLSCGSNPLRGDSRGCYLSAVPLLPSLLLVSLVLISSQDGTKMMITGRFDPFAEC